MKENDHLYKLRHSAEHVLHQAVKELYPSIHLAMGPATDDGFYFDFDSSPERREAVTITDADFKSIEKRMRYIINKNLPITRHEISATDARKLFADNPYKQEWIEKAEKLGELITIYWTGEPNAKGSMVDLCAGPHVDSTGEIKAFKLLTMAGAYWHGDEKNKMLTRIYGTAFESKEDLEKYLWQLEEAKKRDHKKLGPQLDYFHFQSEAPGMPFWHPKGMVLRNSLFEFSRKIQSQYGYKEIQAPNLLDIELFKKSGHWDHYKDNMFFTEGMGKKQYALRPMDCPGTIQIYNVRPRSHKDLPLRLSEYGTVTRKEKSGELNGLFRVAQITQDDAHIFVTPDNIQDIVVETMKLAKEIYEVFGISFKIYLSTRPDNYMGDLKVWNAAEESLKNAIEEQGVPLLLKEKDGAFYGPKIDYQLEDSLGRTWQCGTIQLDFQMPEVFDLHYVGDDGNQHRPVIIHRTIMGSIERFIGILMEHYAGAFPLWLSPEQVTIIPIAERHREAAQAIATKLQDINVRFELDDKALSMQKKIRNAQHSKVNYMLILGDTEVESGEVNVRSRDGSTENMSVEGFIQKVQNEIESKK